MKPTHQILIEKIMEKFKPTEHEENGKVTYTQGFTYMTQQGLEQIYNEFLEGLEEPTNSADAIFEQAAKIEAGIHVTVDKIVDDVQTFAFEPQRAAELGYEGVKKLITAVQDNAIEENRAMIRDLQGRIEALRLYGVGSIEKNEKEIRELKNFITVVNAEVSLMNKRLLNLEDQNGKDTIKEV